MPPRIGHAMMFKQVPDAAYDRSDAKTQCIGHQSSS